jgi:hypothetical protein
MGLGTHGGRIHMTDDDRIELSNLSRQFLFRRRHVGHSKSTSAAEAAIEMNPDIKSCLTAMENRVEPKSEDIFTDAFWDQQDFIVNALDNQQARKYVDSKCVTHKKPLFESGTLGTQANSVICLPYKTPSYAEGAVAGEEQGIAKVSGPHGRSARRPAGLRKQLSSVLTSDVLCCCVFSVHPAQLSVARSSLYRGQSASECFRELLVVATPVSHAIGLLSSSSARVFLCACSGLVRSSTTCTSRVPMPSTRCWRIASNICRS